MLRSLVNAMHANRAVYAGQVSTGQDGNVSVANSLYFY